MQLSSGTRIGRYEITDPLGIEGIGARYAALDLSGPSKVVVRLLPATVVDTPERLSRFERTATLLLELHHPNLARLLDFGRHRDACYLVWERGEQELVSCLAERQPSAVEALRWLVHVAEALGFAHQKGVLHLDLRPLRLWVSRDRRIKVADLGVMSLVERDQQFGSVDAPASRLAYLAPEQLRGEPVDQRTDVWAFGALGFELFARRRLFAQDSVSSLFSEILEGAPTRLRESRPDCPVLLEDLLAACVERDPERRPPSFREVLSTLESVSARLPPEGEGGDLGDPTAELEEDNGRDAALGALESEEVTAEHELAELEETAEHEPVDLDVVRSAIESNDLATAQRTLETGPEWETATADLTELREAIESANQRGRQSVSSPPIQDARFSVYRPRSVAVEQWRTLLVVAHSEELAEEAGEDIEQLVATAVERELGEEVKRYTSTVQDASQDVPRAGEITLVPAIPGVELNPPSRTFRWSEPVHRESFRLRVTAHHQAGETLRGGIAVFLGPVLIADIPVRLPVVAREDTTPATERESGSVYRRIFVSYSRRDRVIVEELKAAFETLGDRILRDVDDLPSGQRWSAALQEMIRRADVFQLFWSWNSSSSKFVRNEWEYALGLARPSGFMRPFCWEHPWPEPPPELADLHFAEWRRTESVPAPAKESLPSPAPAVPAVPAAPAAPPAPAAPAATRSVESISTEDETPLRVPGSSAAPHSASRPAPTARPAAAAPDEPAPTMEIRVRPSHRAAPTNRGAWLPLAIALATVLSAVALALAVAALLR